MLNFEKYFTYSYRGFQLSRGVLCCITNQPETPNTGKFILKKRLSKLGLQYISCLYLFYIHEPPHWRNSNLSGSIHGVENINPNCRCFFTQIRTNWYLVGNFHINCKFLSTSVGISLHQRRTFQPLIYTISFTAGNFPAYFHTL